MTKTDRKPDDGFDLLLDRAIHEDLRATAPEFITARILREAKKPGARRHPLRDRLRGRLHIAVPTPGLLAASFAALLVATPVTIAKWPGGADVMDRTILALATGDPLGIDPALRLITGPGR